MDVLQTCTPMDVVLKAVYQTADPHAGGRGPDVHADGRDAQDSQPRTRPERIAPLADQQHNAMSTTAFM